MDRNNINRGFKKLHDLNILSKLRNVPIFHFSPIPSFHYPGGAKHTPLFELQAHREAGSLCGPKPALYAEFFSSYQPVENNQTPNDAEIRARRRDIGRKPLLFPLRSPAVNSKKSNI
jgi:hypothetical protein